MDLLLNYNVYKTVLFIFLRLVYIVTGIAVLLGSIGYLITEIVVDDRPAQFSESDISLTQKVLGYTHVCLDNPIEQLIILKYQIVSLEFEDPPAEDVPLEVGILDSNKHIGSALQRTVPEGYHDSYMLPGYKVTIRAYTLFAIPITTISIWGKGSHYFLRCKRL